MGIALSVYEEYETVGVEVRNAITTYQKSPKLPLTITKRPPHTMILFVPHVAPTEQIDSTKLQLGSNK